MENTTPDIPNGGSENAELDAYFADQAREREEAIDAAFADPDFLKELTATDLQSAPQLINMIKHPGENGKPAMLEDLSSPRSPSNETRIFIPSSVAEAKAPSSWRSRFKNLFGRRKSPSSGDVGGQIERLSGRGGNEA